MSEREKRLKAAVSDWLARARPDLSAEEREAAIAEFLELARKQGDIPPAD
jgi:hypothetical protein